MRIKEVVIIQIQPKLDRCPKCNTNFIDLNKNKYTVNKI